MDLLGRRWREKPLAERLLPAWVYVVVTAMSLALGMWCWVGIDDQTPLARSRVVAVVFWFMTPILAWMAVLSRRVRGRR